MLVQVLQIQEFNKQIDLKINWYLIDAKANTENEEYKFDPLCPREHIHYR